MFDYSPCPKTPLLPLGGASVLPSGTPLLPLGGASCDSQKAHDQLGDIEAEPQKLRAKTVSIAKFEHSARKSGGPFENKTFGN